MSTTSSVLTDDTRLSATDRALLRVESVLNLASGFTVFALVLLAITFLVNVGGLAIQQYTIRKFEGKS